MHTKSVISSVADLCPGEPTEEEGVHGQPGAEVRAAPGRGHQLEDKGREPGGRQRSPQPAADRPGGQAAGSREEEYHLHPAPRPEDLRYSRALVFQSLGGNC